MLSQRWFYTVPGRETEHGGHEEERKVAWLELFYDLVFVATLIELGNLLSSDVSGEGFLRFVILFIPVWWAWSGITFYANRFTVDDVWHRLLIFVQIFCIATVAISIAGVFDDADLRRQFVAGYAGVRVILVLLYVRGWFAVEEARPLTLGYIIGFVIGASLWLISAFTAPPVTYVLWGLALLVELGTPLIPYMVKWQAVFPPHIEHMSERYGIFTIIVLGEAFVKVIGNLSGTQIDSTLLFATAATMPVAFGLWWLYFDDVAGSDVNGTGFAPYVWIYGHLPVAIGITGFGVVAKKLLEQPAGDPLAEKYRLLTGGVLVLYFVFVAIIDRVTHREDAGYVNNRVRSNWRFLSAGLMLVLTLLGTGFTPGAFAGLASLIFFVQIAVDELPDRSGVHRDQAEPEPVTH